MSNTDQRTLLREIRAKQREAQDEGDSREANRLFQEEQVLIGLLKGNQPVVGKGGRWA